MTMAPFSPSSRRTQRSSSKAFAPSSSSVVALLVLVATSSSSWSPWSPKTMYASAFARSLLPHRLVDRAVGGSNDDDERVPSGGGRTVATRSAAHGGGGGVGGSIFALASASAAAAAASPAAGRASATALSMGVGAGDGDKDRACAALQSSTSADVDEVVSAGSTNGASTAGAADGTEQIADRFSDEEEAPITTEHPNGTLLKSKILADDAQFLKSGPDSRRYRCIELPTNSLRILLVSDPDADVESAAMHVKTGHFADPANRAGLAHFHEHMLFLGTKKYPGEDDYEGFLGRNGGSSNAYTDMEDTNYYFNVAPLDHDDDVEDEEEGDDMGANMDAPLATAAEEGEAEAAPTAEVGGEEATTAVSKALSGALDRFAQFFISPTFDPSMIERELKAVDSEYNNGKTSDAWRNYQLLKENANEHHPFHKFGCGNYKTLTDGGDINHDQGEECIGERGGGSLEASGGTNPRDDLVQFWTDHYHAGKLKLCVLGKANLDDLQAEVEKIFDGVRPAPEGYEDDKSRSERLYQEWLKEQGVEPKQPLTFPTEHVTHGHSGTRPAFGPPQLRKIREVVPIVESRNLRVSFACPPMDDPVLEESRPFRVLSHLLGHESPGSLHYLLNGEGLINGLSSGVGVDTSDFSLTTITVSLTPEGMRQRDRVLSLVFKYIKLVRDAVANDEHGIIEKYHEELRQISKTNFRFRENGDSTDFCSSAAELLHHYEPEKLLAGSALVGEYDARVAEAFLERMTPENALITILNSDLGKEGEATDDDDSASCKTSTSAAPWHHEHWYGAKYREVEISDELISLWKDPPSIEESLFLPNLNEFIPSDFSLRCDDAANKAAEDPDTDNRKEVPKLLIDRPELRLWHKMDRTFRVPKTSIRLQLTSPAVYQSPRSITLNRLYQKVLSDDLNSYVYDASLAGCSYRVACVPSSFRISVTGYSEKLPHLLDVVTTRMQTLIEEMKEGPDARPALAQRFQKAHENLLRETKNFKLDSPYETGNYNSRMLIEDPVWHIERYLDEMEGEYAVKNPLSMKECAEVAEQCLFGPSKAMSLCMGNIDEESALEVGNMITQHFLKARPLSEDENPRIRSLKLPTKEEAARIFGPEAAKRAIPCVYEAMAHSPSEENSSVELILQTGSDHELGYEGIAIQELIGHIAYNSAYSQLRTREQLGYIVSAFTRKMTGQSNSLCVLVQSSTALPAALEERCEAWIEQYRQELVDMPAKRIAMEATAVVAQLLERDTKLMDEISSRYGEILGTVTHTDVHQPAFDRLERLAKELIVDDEEVIEQLEIVTDGEGEPPKATKTAAELKQQVIDFFDKYFMPSSPERRAMSARVYSQKGKETFESHKGKPGVLSSYEDARRLKQFLAAFPTAPYWYNR